MFTSAAWAAHSQVLVNSILSIYYRYLIQGIIHLQSLYVNVKILSLKKLASKVEIESINRLVMICGLLGNVMDGRVGCWIQFPVKRI